MNRQEHLQWCKDRAIAYCRDNNPQEAVTSFMSDMSKHEETKDHSAIPLMLMMMIGGHLSTPESVEDFINGFN